MRALIGLQRFGCSLLVAMVFVVSGTAVAQVASVDVLAPEISQIELFDAGGSEGNTTVTAVVEDDDRVASVLLSLYANQFRECRNVPEKKLTIEMFVEGTGSHYEAAYSQAQFNKLHENSSVALLQDTCISVEARDRSSNVSTRILDNPPVAARSPAIVDARPKSKLMYIVAGVAAVALLAVVSQSGGGEDGEGSNVLRITAPTP